MAATTDSKMITLRSFDGEEFEFVKVDHATLFDESIKSKDTPKTKAKSAHEEEEDDENGVPAEDDKPENSESKEKEFESEEEAEDNKKKDPEEKSSGKKVDKDEGKSKESEESRLCMEDLRLYIHRFLRTVDLHRVTFADMIEDLHGYYGIDMTPCKAAVRQMVSEEMAILEEESVICDDE